MQKPLRMLAIALISALAAVGLTVPAHGAPPLKTGTKLTFTDSRGVQSYYHMYADGIDWSKPVGVLYYLDGDYFSESPQHSQVMQPNGAMLKSVAKNANNKNLVLVAPKTPSASTKANGWTWWEKGNTNAKWFHDLAIALQKKGKLDTDNTWLAGYSGGAELISFDLMTQNRTKWMTGGGAILIAGGGSGSNTKPHSANKNIPMTWYAGSKDTSGQTNPPTWSALNAAKQGQKTYKNAGYSSAKINILNGVGHHGYSLANLINKTTTSAKGSSSPSTSTTKTEAINLTYQTTRANVKIMDGRGTKAQQLASIPKSGTRVALIERYGSWAKVKYGNTTGWSPWAHYVQSKNAAPVSGGTLIDQTYATQRAKVSLTTSRAKGAETAVTLSPQGTPVTVLERHGSWAWVEYQGKTYWAPFGHLTR